MVENQTHDLLSSTALEQLHSLGPVWKPAGAVTEVAEKLRRAKYYLRLNGGPLTGNGQIEAIMAGCLAVGNPDTYVQRSLFTPQTVCRTPAEAMEKILHWEGHPQRLEKELQDQRTMAEWICFRRPAWQLLQRIR
jgi:hypothetical protein